MYIYCNSISARWWRMTERRDSLSKNGHNSHIGWSSATCSLSWKWQSTQITLVLIGAMQPHSGLEDSSNQTKWLKEKVLTSTLSAFKQAHQTPFSQDLFRGNIASGQLKTTPRIYILWLLLFQGRQWQIFLSVFQSFDGLRCSINVTAIGK